MKYNTAKGFSLNSFLLSLLICGSLLSVCCSSFSPLIIHSRFFSKKLTEQEALMHVAAVFKLMAREIDYHRLSIPPKVFHQGRISFSDGTQIPIQPDQNSDAVANITFRGDEAFIVQHYLNQKIYGCFRSDARPSKPTSLLLGISPDGERLFKSSSPLGANRCDEFSIVPSSSLVLSEALIPEETIRLFYPVSREYLLYLNTAHELKYLSVIGKEIIEHQPLEREIYSISLITHTLNTPLLYLFDLHLSGISQSISIPLSHVLVRAPSRVLLFNL